MEARSERSVRDRAIWIVRGATFGAMTAAFGLSWVSANLAQAYFSGKPPAPPLPPNVPLLAAPVQKAPVVIKSVVHHPYNGPVFGGGAPRPPSGGPVSRPVSGPGPAPPPPPPPPPVCHSTPSKPC